MKEYSFDSYPVMAAINELDFFLNLRKEKTEECLKTESINLVAMNVLASGRLQPAKAYEYLGKLPRVNSICFGASTINHVEENLNAISKFTSANV